MRAMILAAGFGTRLRPLTNNIPKALVLINGKPLLEYQLESLQRFGFKQVVVNAHHLAEQVKSFLDRFQSQTTMDIFYSYEPHILNTGGGIKKMLDFFPGDDPIVVQNVDIISSIQYDQLIQHHLKNKSLATLAINRNETDRGLAFNESLNFLGRFDAKLHRIEQKYCFCGIQVIQPQLFRDKIDDIFYSIDVYCETAKSIGHIKGFDITGLYWRDIGTPEDVEALTHDIKHGIFKPSLGLK